MTFFKDLEPAPADPILNLTQLYRADSNPNKINLGVGIYHDEEGVSPVLSCVRKAKEQVLSLDPPQGYQKIPGPDEYGSLVQQLLFGADHEIISSNRAVTALTPGGTGGLRVFADLIARLRPGAAIWVSDPTWANHHQVFKAAGIEIKAYPYFDSEKNDLDFGKMKEALGKTSSGDILLLHGCCHNPTGIDPTVEQWKELSSVIKTQNLLPLIDFAYQGFWKGIEEDREPFLNISDSPFFICNSFSKNFGLYYERVGALTYAGTSTEDAELVLGHMKSTIRANYSNPPWHGQAIVSLILKDPSLRAEWIENVSSMRARLHEMRELFVETLAAKGATRDFSFVRRQQGMFSFCGLDSEQIETLREKYSIYLVGSSRMNIAGMTKSNMDYLCEAIVSVL